MDREYSPISKEDLISLISRDDTQVIDVEQLNDEVYPKEGFRSYKPNGRWIILLKTPTT